MSINSVNNADASNWEVLKSVNFDASQVSYSSVRGRLVTGVEGWLCSTLRKICKWFSLGHLLGKGQKAGAIQRALVHQVAADPGQKVTIPQRAFDYCASKLRQLGDNSLLEAWNRHVDQIEVSDRDASSGMSQFYLERASELGLENLGKHLVESGTPINVNESNPLEKAILHGQYELVDAILNGNVSADTLLGTISSALKGELKQQGRTVPDAVLLKSVEVTTPEEGFVRPSLVQQGATYVSASGERCSLKQFRQLLPDERLSDLLRSAVRLEQYEMAERLILAQVDLDLEMYDGESPRNYIQMRRTDVFTNQPDERVEKLITVIESGRNIKG